MTAPTLPAATSTGPGGLEQTPAKHHPYRWRMNRAGIVNVWHYYDTSFVFSGGRMILRGTNGSGKSRALEMLLPFVLDADRRKMDATGSAKVNLEDLMKAGGDGQGNRLGYLWLELERTRPGSEPTEVEHLTVGALVRFSASTSTAKAWYFTTDLRIDHDLLLLDGDRQPLSREKLTELIGADRITDSAETHRERIRSSVFGLTGQLGQERFTGLLQLLHTLRSPDVGNQIDAGDLPRILSRALPPLSETSLKDAGERLDGLLETRTAQLRMEVALSQVATFAAVYRRYTAAALHTSASAVTRASRQVRDAERTAAAAVEELERLVAGFAAGQVEVTALANSVDELSATMMGIKESEAYNAGRDLDDRAGRVAALADAARSALLTAAAARDAEADAAAAVDAAGAEVVEEAARADAALDAARKALVSAAVQHGALPDRISATLRPSAARQDPVRLTLDSDEALLARPQPAVLDLVPPDLDVALTNVEQVAAAAKARTDQAMVRLRTARDLDRERTTVGVADTRASDADARASHDEQDAAAAVEHRDVTARALATRWRTWTALPQTRGALGPVAWPLTPVGPLLLDLNALRDDAADLAELDRTPTEAARSAFDALAQTAGDLDRDDRTDAQARRQLLLEQAGLHAAQDPVPPAAPWAATLPAQVPALWQVIDFAAEVDDASRAGLEAALLASGLLSAGLSADGSLVAADGQVLLALDGPLAPSPLGALVTVDPAGPADAAVVTAVLDRISLHPGHSTWVSPAGTWGVGVLRGQHSVPVARHIGAAARAAARAARLEVITGQLADLDGRATGRTAARAALRDRSQALAEHLLTAPGSAALGTARVRAADAAERAFTSRRTAAEVAELARTLRATWRAALGEHEKLCSAQDLPNAAAELEQVVDLSGAAQRATAAVGAALTAVGRSHGRCETLRAGFPARTARRVQMESTAQVHHSDWASQVAQFAALSESIGQAADAVRLALAEAERQHRSQKSALAILRDTVDNLGQQAAAARFSTAGQQERALAAQTALVAALSHLRWQAQSPGVFAAACADPAAALPAELVGGATDQAAADRSARAVLDLIGATVPADSDETTLQRALQTLDRASEATYDVVLTIAHGLRLVELVDESGRQPVARYLAYLSGKVAEGAAALTAREHEVFTQFVLGGVGEELRRRLGQAEQLVGAMNDSLGSIRTSHGIGVKLTWALSDDVDGRTTRIRELVRTNTAVRPAAQNEELIALLRQRVEDSFSLDETSGYAFHLKSALDYRQWHTMEVIILGPAPGQQRKVSKRAKLSQGETRFVSYVTLFAAVDAYLSGLPDTEMPLRVILLDDAFAKVDDRTIGELMGLLVRLDIDFCMTGHALWGTYPQVPSLDVYEVRRAEGTAAVTTRVHWDGHSRHLRAAP